MVGGNVFARKRIVLITVSSVLTAVTVLGIYLYSQLYSNALNTMYGTIQLLSEQSSRNIGMLFQGIQNDLLGIATTESMRKWMHNPNYFDEGDNFLRAKLQLEEELKYRILFNNVWDSQYINTLSVYKDDRWLCHIYFKQVNINEFTRSMEKVVAEVNRQTKPFQTTYLLPPADYRSPMIYAKRFLSTANEENNILLIFGTEQNSLRTQYENMADMQGVSIYVTDQNGLVYSSTDQAAVGSVMSLPSVSVPMPRIFTLFGSNASKLASTMVVPETPFYFTAVIEQDVIHRQVLANMTPYLWFSVLITLLIVLLFTILALRSTRFINDFVAALNQVTKGNYMAKMPIYRNMEMNQISLAFNYMTSEFQCMIEDKYEKQLLLREMDIKFLQHQMNPHFLFNTLLTIQLKAKENNQEDLYQMVYYLSDLLRAGIYNESTTKAPIGRELEYIESYLYLQKCRFLDRLSYTIQVSDPHVLKFLIPRLTLEPLVENAVVHGMEEGVEECNIAIVLEERDDCICCKVLDDGCGFDIDSLTSTKSFRTGIKNVSERLRLLYGESYGVQISSIKGAGTTVTLTLPKDKG